MYYQIPQSLFTYQSSVRACLKITNCEQFRAKFCLKITATLTLDTTDIFLIKLIQEYTSRGSPEWSKKLS